MSKVWIQRAGWAFGLGSVIVTAILTYMASNPLPMPVDPPIDPPTDEVVPMFGWGGEEGAEQAYAAVADKIPQYEIAEDQPDDPTKTVVLWVAARENNGGKHLPTFRQLIGDCVGASSLQATQYLLATKFDGQYTPLWIGYTYACGRMAPDLGAGRLRGPDGSFGSYQALAAQKYGWLLASEGPEYNSQTIRQWAVRMPSSADQAKARERIVQSVKKVTTADEIRRAIQAGYPVTIASNWGGLMTPPVVEIGEGRKIRLNRRSGSWPHQMVVIGYLYAGDSGYWYVLNSWGANAHGAPVNDEPPGGFWIAKKDMDFIAQSDCWAYSDAKGFPQRDLDFQIFDADGFQTVRFGRAPEPKDIASFDLAM